MDSTNSIPPLLHNPLHSSFDDWTQGRELPSLGTNAGASKLPFQTWHHFKEAFAPELVDRALKESERKVKRCADPFGGSGTTALACQFLGVEPVTIEVNPYLADLIEAKLVQYHCDSLVKDLGTIIKHVYGAKPSLKRFAGAPATFIEAADKPRWIFNAPIARRIAAYLEAIDSLIDPNHRRFFRVQLGGLLVQVSNIVVNGKGRRYRRNWESREISIRDLDNLFAERSERAIVELHEHRFRHVTEYTLLRGDCRTKMNELGPIDSAIFSPPYPNSFDYTDVYNIELWMLGYLGDSIANRNLRHSTLCSHVQIKRSFPAAPKTSKRLTRTLKRLREVRASLWNPWIPEMVGAYFADMSEVLSGLERCLSSKGEIWSVVGDSRYAGIHVPTASILADLSPALGLEVKVVESFRSMRSSAQQGGREELDETLLVLRKSS